MDIKIVKELGSGVMGTVYLIESSGKKYVYKIEKMENPEAYNRQIIFDREVAQKNPKYFLTLKSYGIINFCPHKQPIPKWVTGSFRENLIKKNKSESCYYLVYGPVLKSTLAQLGSSIYEKKTMYKKMIQDVITAINITKKAGFTHNDIHSGNIMSDDRNNFYIIDYGRISHKSFKLSVVEKEIKKYELNDADMILWNVLVFNGPIEYMIKNKMDIPPYKKFTSAIRKHEEFHTMLKNISHVKYKKEDIAIFLTAIYHPEIYCKCLGLKKTIHLIVPYPKFIHYYIDHMFDKNFDIILKYINKL